MRIKVIVLILSLAVFLSFGAQATCNANNVELNVPSGYRNVDCTYTVYVDGVEICSGSTGGADTITIAEYDSDCTYKVVYNQTNQSVCASTQATACPTSTPDYTGMKISPKAKKYYSSNDCVDATPCMSQSTGLTTAAPEAPDCAETPNQTQTATPVETPAPAETSNPAETPVSTETPVATATPVPTATAVATAPPTATPTPVPTEEPTPVPTAKPTQTPASGSSSSSLASQVVALVNEYRAEYGLSPVSADSNLTAAACVRAKEIAVSFSHTRPDGSSWSTVSSLARGENIAMGYNTAEKVMAAWMTSEGHRANILRESFTTIGVCAYEEDGILYWAQEFGTN